MYNYNINDHNINSLFYKELFQWWAEFRTAFSTDPLVYETIIWNNKDIRIDSKPIYYPNYVKTGILQCKDLYFNENTLQSFNTAKTRGLKDTNFLIWLGVRSAIPSRLKTLQVNGGQLEDLKFYYGEEILDPVLCKSKRFYEMIISKKATFSRGFLKLKADFELDDPTVEKAFLNAKLVTSETFVRCFQPYGLNKRQEFHSKNRINIAISFSTCTSYRIAITSS